MCLNCDRLLINHMLSIAKLTNWWCDKNANICNQRRYSRSKDLVAWIVNKDSKVATNPMYSCYEIHSLLLIPKGDDRSTDVKRWCSIALLNTIYKDLCKASRSFASRYYIHLSQTSFLPEPGIFDNIFTFWSVAAQKGGEEWIYLYSC